MSRIIPHYRQQKDYTCGPASMRMLLASHDVHVSEEDLATFSGTSVRLGTPRSGMLKALRKHGMRCRATSHGTLRELLTALEEGPVLVNYVEPSQDVGHFALVTRQEGGSFLLHDPWNGEDFRMSPKAFEKRWLGYKTGDKNGGWMVKVTQIKSRE